MGRTSYELVKNPHSCNFPTSLHQKRNARIVPYRALPETETGLLEGALSHLLDDPEDQDPDSSSMDFENLCHADTDNDDSDEDYSGENPFQLVEFNVLPHKKIQSTVEQRILFERTNMTLVSI
jgi:hypothetical protein